MSDFLGYLEKQQLDTTYAAFVDASRHLAKEKKELKHGNKPIDTSIGLVKIVSEHFKFKSRISEFLRSCPHSPLIDRLIDTQDSLEQLDIILETFKSNLKCDKFSSRKRKQNEREDNFNVSQSNASTPEPENAAKRRRKSLTTPFLIASTSKVNHSSKSSDKSKVHKPSLKYSPSSSESSDSKEDIHEDTGCSSAISKIRTTPPIAEVRYIRFSSCF